MAKTTRQRLEKLKKSHADLAENLAEIGVGASSADGLGDLAQKALAAVVPKGEVKSVKVSSAGTVFQGDRIRKTKEFRSTDQIRFVLEGASVIASQRLRENTIVVLFAQDGDTYIKAMQYTGGAWTLGNTCLVLEADVPIAASIVVLGDNCAAVLFNSDAAGVIAKVAFTGLNATLAWTDLFDAYDPVNIAAANYIDPDTPASGNDLVVTFVRHGLDYAGTAYLLALTVGTHDAAIGEPVEMALTTTKVKEDGTTETSPVELAYSKDEYVRAWGIAVHGPTIYVSFYRADNKHRGLLVAARDGLNIICKKHQCCALSGDLPTVSMCDIPGVPPLGSIALAHGLTRVQGNATKTMLGLEIWHGVEDVDRLLPLCFGEEDITYSTNIGRVCVAVLDKDTLVVGYSINDAMRVMAVDINAFHPLGGPSVQVCNFNSYAEIVPISAATAVVVYQYNGSGFAKAMSLTNVVVSSTSEESDGIAKTGGGSGSTIQIYSMSD